MNFPYFTDILNKLKPMRPSLLVEEKDESIELTLYVKNNDKHVILGTVSAAIYSDSEYHVLGSAAYPSIGGAMYCFTMMALRGNGFNLMSSRDGANSSKSIEAWQRLGSNPGIDSRPASIGSWTEDVIDGVIDQIIENNKHIDEDKLFELMDDNRFDLINPETFTKSYTCIKDENYVECVLNHRESISSVDELEVIRRLSADFYSECYDLRDSASLKDESIFDGVRVAIEEAKEMSPLTQNDNEQVFSI